MAPVVLSGKVSAARRQVSAARQTGHSAPLKAKRIFLAIPNRYRIPCILSKERTSGPYVPVQKPLTSPPLCSVV